MFFKSRRMKKLGNQNAYTMVELLITMVVAALVLNGVIMSLINSMILNEYNQEFSKAMNIARQKAEDVMTNKSNLDNVLNQTGTLSLATDGIAGLFRVDVRGVDNVTLTQAQLLNVRIAVCWQSRSGRIVGECLIDGSGVLRWKPYIENDPWAALSSPCIVETSVAQR